MFLMVITLETFQLLRGRLKGVPSNMPPMSVTFETSQPSRCWLKEAALENMRFMSLTEETSQSEISPLKAPVSANMPDMPVTRLRFGVSVAG